MPTIYQGWNTLPYGCGGLAIGMCIVNKEAVFRTDVSGIYRFTGLFPDDIADPTKHWLPLLTMDSLGITDHPRFGMSSGGFECVIAPTATTNLYAIFADAYNNETNAYVYYSLDSGAHWTKVPATAMQNADSNNTGNVQHYSYNKQAAYKIAVDPNNANVVYCGLPAASSNAFSVYRCTDGTTANTSFTGIPTSVLPLATQDPGVCGIVFDQNSGLVTGVGGLQVTKRIIIPIGGQGIYESNDGGLTFTETAVTAMGGSNISVYLAQMDFDGVYYAVVQRNPGGGVYANITGEFWRYGDVVNSRTNCTWARLDNQANWAGQVGFGPTAIPVVDPRSGHQGYVNVMNNGALGATSKNANVASAAAVLWHGWTGGNIGGNYAPSYDVPWLSHGMQGYNVYMGATYSIIDQYGYCWWCGNQGAIWYYTKSDNVTPTIPDFTVPEPGGTPTNTYSTSISRGMEATIASDCLRPPGGTYPIIGPQDVGISLGGTFTTYPTDYFKSGTFMPPATGGGNQPPPRRDCGSLCWAPFESGVVSMILTVESDPPSTMGASGYSQNYGASWTEFAEQPTYFVQSNGMAFGFKGYIAPATFSCIGGVSGNTLTVTAGNVIIGGTINGGGVVYNQQSGTANGAGAYSVNMTYDGSGSNPAPIAPGTAITGSYGLLTVPSGGAGQGALAVDDYFLTYGRPWCVADISANGNGLKGTGIAKNTTCITQFISGNGWEGTYAISANTLTVGSAGSPITDLGEDVYSSQSGTIVCFDHNHHIMVPMGYNNITHPIYTANAGASWAHCAGLPSLKWLQRPFANGATNKLFAVDPNPSEQGTVYAIVFESGAIVKSTDYGATWSTVGSIPSWATWQGGLTSGFYLLAVPGYPKHLWFVTGLTAWRSTVPFFYSEDGGASWTAVPMPATTNLIPNLFTMGAPQTPGNYPTLYAQFWSGNPSPGTLYYSTDGPATTGASWKILGATGTAKDLPLTSQLQTMFFITGDWDQFGLIYAGMGGCGFAYYSMTGESGGGPPPGYTRLTLQVSAAR